MEVNQPYWDKIGGSQLYLHQARPLRSFRWPSLVNSPSGEESNLKEVQKSERKKSKNNKPKRRKRKKSKKWTAINSILRKFWSHITSRRGSTQRLAKNTKGPLLLRSYWKTSIRCPPKTFKKKLITSSVGTTVILTTPSSWGSTSTLSGIFSLSWNSSTYRNLCPFKSGSL